MSNSSFGDGNKSYNADNDQNGRLSIKWAQYAHHDILHRDITRSDVSDAQYKLDDYLLQA